MGFKEVIIKPRINKANGQINFNIPRKKLSLKDLDKINSGKPIKFLFEGMDNE